MVRRIARSLSRLNKRRVAQLALRGWPVARPLGFVVAWVLIVLLVHREVYTFVVKDSRFSLPPTRLALAPPWARGREIEVDLGGGSSLSLLDPDLARTVGDAFQECPWVGRVTEVRKVFPDRLVVRFDYRRPHLALHQPGGFVLIDPQGVRLPGVYGEPPPCEHPYRVTGVVSAPPPPGHSWFDPSVRAALEMANLLHGDEVLGRMNVVEIDVSNLGGRLDPRRSEVALVTASGCALEWGRLDSSGRFGNPASEEKVGNLRQVLTAYPGLAGLRRVKLYTQGARAVEPREPGIPTARAR